jgi:hypothetical protein
MRWCALVGLLAISALTVSVATRYSSTENSPPTHTKVLQKHSAEEPSRQRLTTDAASWIPPVVVAVQWYSPSTYPHFAIVAPSVPSLAFVSSLYYRPPPTRSL